MQVKYITKNTKVKDLPAGNYRLICDNYVDNSSYWLIGGKLAKETGFNSKYDFTYYKTNVRSLKASGLYIAKEIKSSDYGLFNI